MNSNDCFLLSFSSSQCSVIKWKLFGDLVNLDRNKDYFIVSCFWLIASSLVTKS